MATNTDEREEIKPVAPTEQTKWRDPSLVGKYMVDPKTGLAGLFRSPDNGETWVLTDTVYGHVYNQDEVDNIWDNGAGHKVADEVKSATADLPNVRKQADEAVKFAESAIAASKVNSDAIVAQSEAISEAKSAMDSATAEIQQLKANAASDVAQIRADVAQVQNEVDTAKAANSASVDKLKSDIGLAQKDLDNVHDSLTKAQSAIEQNQKLINDSVAKINSDIAKDRKDMDDTRTQLSNVQDAIAKNRQDLESNVAKINNDIAQDRKDITEAQQANTDTAKKLDSYTKQATEQGKTIKDLQANDDSMKLTIADVKGNVSQVQDSVTGLTASLKDANDNLATVKVLADSLSATLTDHGKNIANLQATVKELSSTLGDADGRLSKVEQTAEEQSTTLSTVQGNLSQVKQTADGLTDTLKDAQGDIAKVQATAKGLSEQITNAQGAITDLQTDVTGIKATIADHDKNIHTLQADAKSLTDDMTDAQGNISKLQKTAGSVESSLEDTSGRLSKVEQTAKEHTSTISDLGKKVDSNSGGVNLLTNSQGPFRPTQKIPSATVSDNYDVYNSDVYMVQGQTYTVSGQTNGTWSGTHDTEHVSDNCVLWLTDNSNVSQIISADTMPHTFTWPYPTKSYHLRVNAYHHGADNPIYAEKVKIERGSVATPYSPAPEDLATVTQVKQTADGIETTLKSAQGDIDQIKQTAKGTSEQLSNVQGDVTNIQKDVNGLKQTTADNAGNIHTLQADSKTLKDDMADAKGNISSLQKTATSLDSEFEDHNGRISKVEQTASKLINEFADQQGHLNRVEQTAQGTQQTVADQQGQINNIKTDAAGIHETLTGQGNQIANINVTLNGLNTKYEGVSGDLGKLKGQVTTNSTQITQNKQAIALKADQSTVNNLSGEVSQNKAQLKVQADQISSKVSSTDFKALNDKFNDMKIGGRNLVIGTGQDTIIDDTANAGTQGWCFWIFNLTQQPKIGDQITVSAESTLTGKGNLETYEVILYNSTTTANRSDSKRLATGKRSSATLKVTNLNGTGDTVLLIYAGNIADTEGKKNVVHHLKVEFGNVSTDWTPAPEDTITAIQKNSTAIDQTDKKISLKADQTEVDKVKGTASQNSSRIDVMANEIKQKVDGTTVNNILDSKGYATMSYAQTLVKQTKDQWDVTATNLDAEIKDNNGGGINLLKATDFSSTDLTRLKDVWGPSFTLRDGCAMQLDNLKGNSDLDATQFLPVEPDTDYTLSFEAYYNTVASGGSYNNIYTFIVEYKDQNNTTSYYLDHMRVVANTADRSKNIQTIHTQKDCHYVRVLFRASAKTLFSFWRPKLERGSVATPWSPALSDLATVTQISNLQVSIDGIQGNVTNLKNDTSSKLTQLSNTFQSKIGDAQIAINDLKDKTLWKITDSVDLNNVVTQQKIFVKGGSNLPPGGYWWYVQVEPGYDSRIVQYAVSDRDNLHYSRQYDGSKWSAWSQGATESEITQLRDDINLRVKSGDLLSQINLTAGNTLIQSNKLYLDASSVAFSGRAFIPSAAIAEIDADKLTFYGNGTKATIGAGIAEYDQDKFKSTINMQYSGGFEIHASNELGSILTMHDNTVRLASKSQTYSEGSGKPLDQQYSGFWASSNYALINAVDGEGKNTGWSIGPSNSNGYRAYLYDGSTSIQPDFGVGIGTQRFDVYAGGAGLYLGPDKAELRDKSYTTIHSDTETFIEGGNQQIHMYNGEVNIGNPNDTGSATGVHLRVFGWASFNGYVEGMGWTTKSTLSSKTRIEKLDTKDALNKIMETDLETYQYKAEVAGGMTKRHAGPIIDDVHDVAQYSTPDEFINERRTGRSDADVIGYLMGAVQELKKQLDEMKKEVQING